MTIQTRAQLIATIDADLADNTSGDITPSVHRAVLADVADSHPDGVELHHGDLTPANASTWMRVTSTNSDIDATDVEDANEIIVDLGWPTSTTGGDNGPSAHRHTISVAQLDAYRTERSSDPASGDSIAESHIPASLRDFVTGTTLSSVGSRDSYWALHNDGSLLVAFRDSNRLAYDARIHLR